MNRAFVLSAAMMAIAVTIGIPFAKPPNTGSIACAGTYKGFLSATLPG
jgi:hypothetical protein